MTVVTEEFAGKVRIPDVCEAEKIKWTRLADLIEKENWQFGAVPKESELPATKSSLQLANRAARQTTSPLNTGSRANLLAGSIACVTTSPTWRSAPMERLSWSCVKKEMLGDLMVSAARCSSDEQVTT
jgi:Domain of unknown function (DUF4411)